MIINWEKIHVTRVDLWDSEYCSDIELDSWPCLKLSKNTNWFIIKKIYNVIKVVNNDIFVLSLHCFIVITNIHMINIIKLSYIQQIFVKRRKNSILFDQIERIPIVFEVGNNLSKKNWNQSGKHMKNLSSLCNYLANIFLKWKLNSNHLNL